MNKAIQYADGVANDSLVKNGQNKRNNEIIALKEEKEKTKTITKRTKVNIFLGILCGLRLFFCFSAAAF